ncbi:hypothetical protein [Paracoccus sp. DMF]|uniref:hypothetical protein n=1 Tax=Paracoccus sp. DMF TaxID=400837 RepID=UPI001103856A|nr:hypothetical protein [Paracoccus sp. DMF]MCV2446311.1 hypothetical protein [Paracoccus sp. DMF]
MAVLRTLLLSFAQASPFWQRQEEEKHAQKAFEPRFAESKNYLDSSLSPAHRSQMKAKGCARNQKRAQT